MRKKLDASAFRKLGEILADPPAPPPAPKEPVYWEPNLTPAQKKLFDSDVKSLLCWGPKGGAKSWGGASKVVKHCYENKNAFGLILVRVQNMAVKGGAWDKLINEVLPEWKQGLGIQDSGVKTDANHCQYVWISNQHGGWSMITVMSCPHANQLRQRIRGVEPSIVFVDELTSCDSHEYYESVAAQLGRRRGPGGVQQYIGACNPEGPSHWVFIKWFIDPFNTETGEKDPTFGDIFFPADENKANLPAGYLEGLVNIYGKNETERARMIDGQWVDMPSGEGLFLGLFNILVHVAPLDDQAHPSRTQWLMPNPEYPLILGLDPGSANNAYIFQQRLPLKDRLKWVYFDEIVSIRKKIKYTALIPIVMRRIRWWRNIVKKEFPMVWISDASAFNQYRAAQGSYDNLEIERIYEANRALYNLEPMKIRPAPNFSGSVKARVMIEQNALSGEEILISSRCVRVKAMYEQLEAENQKKNQPFDADLAMTPKRSDHLHVFDASSYPKLTASVNPRLLIPSAPSSGGIIHVRAA